MRITFVIPYAGLHGGIRVVATYADRLSRRGHRVVVVSGQERMTLRRTVKSLLLGQGLAEPEPTPFFDRLEIEHRSLGGLRAVTDADVPDGDVVVATYYKTVPGVLRLSPSKGAKALFIQGYEVEEGKTNPQLDATWRTPMHKIVVSKWLLELAQTKFGDSTVSHVPNAVDRTLFHAAPRQKNRVPTVGLLYSTCPLKGVDTSVEAFRRLAEWLPSVHLVSFGVEYPSLRLRLPRNAEFHRRPSQEALRTLYARCDVWMCGSNREGFHLPPLEAMACRCPVVATRVGGPLDVINDGVNGFLVDVKDAHALAERASRVLTFTEQRWRQMSDAAYATAETFNWDEATDLFETALEVAIYRSRFADLAMSGPRHSCADAHLAAPSPPDSMPRHI